MDPLNLDIPRVALVLVDLMPRIIALPTGPHSGKQVLERCLRLVDAFRRRGGLVVWVRVERPGTAQPDGSELAVEPRERDVVVVKKSWGAFGSSAIDDELRKRDIHTIVLAGIATNFGVESTGRGADDHGYAPPTSPTPFFRHRRHDRAGRARARLRGRVRLPEAWQARHHRGAAQPALITLSPSWTMLEAG